jgi:hypothetical protein
MLENGVYLPIDLPQSIEISYNPRAIFQLHVWEDSMYQISEGFSDKGGRNVTCFQSAIYKGNGIYLYIFIYIIYS